MLRLDLNMKDFNQASRHKVQKIQRKMLKTIKTIKKQNVLVRKSPLLQKHELIMMIGNSVFWNKLSKKDST